MVLQNIKTFIKQLTKNKLYTVITVFGFAVSLMFVVLISAYIEQELSVDQFHKNKARLYRLVNEANSSFGATIGDKFTTAIPEVESYVRVYYRKDFFAPEGVSNKKLNAEILTVDSAFFNLFSFPLVKGNTEDALKLGNSAILTQKYAQALFGDISPIGKQIRSRNGTVLQVTGIIETFPENTQFRKCDIIANIVSLPNILGYEAALKNDNASVFNYYFLGKPNTSLSEKGTQALSILKKENWYYKQERAKTLEFEPITESYFSSKKGYIRQNSTTLITVLSVIVLVILILAIINYINLTIAQASFRNKEMAIRKLMGSSRSALIKQHILESILLCTVATGIGIFFAIGAEPIFNNLLDTNIGLVENADFHSLLIITAVTLTIGSISGLFPALFLTKLHPAEVIKGSFQRKNKSSYSKVLVSFQFAATIALIICSTAIIKQTNFLRQYDLGFDKENIVEITKYLPYEKRQVFSDALEQIPGIKQFSFVAGSPTGGGNNQSYTYNDKPVSFQEFMVDSAFFSLMGIKYNPTGAAWSKNVLWLNETTVKQLGLESQPKSFKRYNEELPVYGIVEDFHFSDLHEEVGMAMLRPLSDKSWSWSILVKISGGDIAGTMDQIKSAFDSLTGSEPFEYEFIDSTIDNWYRKEANTAKIITYFSLLTIIISIMGILGLITYYNQLRTKEIGIRKVNGAKISEILTMLNKDFIKWVAIAFVLACPIAYYAMNKWLENFAYKTELSWWIFAMAGALAMGIALLTVSWQSWRAASRNPVEALRYE
ncbi:ABC transporter permease [Puteibacter caeruleilacunae]|nr:ABC transporter permease [Puteibacter caeruleilacunae]